MRLKLELMAEKKPITKRQFLKALFLGLAGFGLPVRVRALELLENLENPPPTQIEMDLLKNPHKQILLAAQEEFN